MRLRSLEEFAHDDVKFEREEDAHRTLRRRNVLCRTGRED